MMCKYCEDNVPLVIREDNGVNVIRIDQEAIDLLLIPYSEDNGIHTNIPIEYCPLCGRKLSED